MKKIMIGILILIPLVVLLVMGLVTTFISINAYIGVEDIKLDKHELTLDVNRTYDLDGEGGLFEVTVLPELASDKTYEWTIRNVSSRDANFPTEDHGKDGYYYVELLDAKGNHADSVNAGGKLRVNVYCTFEIVVTAETFSDSCFVVVGGDVAGIALSADSNMRVGDSVVLSPVFTPLDGAAYNITWYSSNKSVADVDRNGILTAVKQNDFEDGKAVPVEIWVTAENSAGATIESNHVEIYVSAATTYFGDRVSVHKDGFSVSEALGIDLDDVTGTSGCTIQDGIFRFNDGATDAVIIMGDEQAFIELCDENEIEIVEKAVLGDDYILEINGNPVYLSVRYKSVLRRGEGVSVTWSADSDIVTVKDGAVFGLRSGSVVVKATSSDDKYAEFPMQVQRKVAVLVSATTQSSLEVGLAKETVFASRAYDENGDQVPNTYSVNVRYPAMFEGEEKESFYEAFEFTTDKPELASFDNESGNGVLDNMLVFDPDNIKKALGEDGRVSITVTIKARYPKYPDMPEYTTASFVISVVDGVEASKYSELKSALQDDKINAVLVSDIDVENTVNVVDGVPTKADQIYTFASVYGNGFTIEAAKDQMVNKTAAVFCVCADNVTFSNMTIRPNAFADEDIDGGSVTIDDANTFNVGYCIRYNMTDRDDHDGVDEYLPTIKGGRVEFCLLENATTLLQLKGADVDVEGCIFRNTGGVAIHVQNTNSHGYICYNNLTMTNCIMSNMVGTGINLDYNYAANYTESIEQRSTFTQKGFLDIYNWQPSYGISLIPHDTLMEILDNNEGAADLLVSTLQRLLVEENNIEGFRRTVDGELYIHLGFISMGLGHPSQLFYGYTKDDSHRRVERVVTDPVTNTWEARLVDTGEVIDKEDVDWNFKQEDERIKYFSSNHISALTSLGNLLKQFGFDIVNNPFYIMGYDDATTDVVPGATYTVNSRLIARLHGE